MSANYLLEYRGPGKRPGTSRQITVKVGSLQEAKDYLIGKDVYSPLATVWSSWKRHVIAILRVDLTVNGGEVTK